VYTKITRFDTPEEAVPDTISVSVSVHNEEPLGARVLLQIWDEAGEVVFHEDRWIDAGATETFTASLTMPDRDYTVTAHTWYWVGEANWIHQDSLARTIRKAAAPPILPPWWEQTFLGVPVWGWLAGVAVAAAIIGVVAYMREKEEELMLMMARR